MTATSAAAGIDFRNCSFSVAPFLAPNLTFSGSALTMTASGAGIELGSITAANTPIIDLHSSGNNNDYDARIFGAGGAATVGQGGVGIIGAYLDVAATVAANSQIRINGTKVLGVRQAAIANHPSDGVVNAILTVMRAHGLIAP